MSTRHFENVVHVIHRFELSDPECQIAMPLCSRILHVGEREGRVSVWAMVEPEGPFGSRRFQVVGTGRVVPDAVYVGTVMVGAFVWHVFDLGFAQG